MNFESEKHVLVEISVVGELPAEVAAALLRADDNTPRILGKPGVRRGFRVRLHDHDIFQRHVLVQQSDSVVKLVRIQTLRLLEVVDRHAVASELHRLDFLQLAVLVLVRVQTIRKERS